MSVVRRALVVVVVLFALFGTVSLVRFAETGMAAQQAPAQWVDPANPSDELVNGPYNVDPNWPKPMSTWPGHAGWTWGAAQGVFAQNQNRIFVAERGELPEVKGKTFPGTDVRMWPTAITELDAGDGRKVRIEAPPFGGFLRNTSVGRIPSPGEPSSDFEGVEGTDYRWEHVVMIMDGQGNMTEAWTQWDKLFAARDIKVSPQGRVHKVLISPYDPEKRVWCVDDGNHVIRVFSNDGKKLLQTIGTYGEKGADGTHFNRQTDLAWLPDGTFFVADGYDGTRVAKFDKDGRFLLDWGKAGEAGKERRPYYMNAVHGIAIDNQRRVYVDDRSNRRIQIFDENGKYLTEWYLGDLAAAYHIYMTADQHLWISDGHANFKFYKFDLTGKLLYTWGTWGPQPGGLWGTHQFSVDQDGNLYTAEVWGGRFQKFVPRKGGDPSVLVGQPLRVAWKD